MYFKYNVKSELKFNFLQYTISILEILYEIQRKYLLIVLIFKKIQR